MKPVELYARAMRNSTRADEICYEPFSGSGTQIIAGEQLGRRVFGIEIDARYVDVAVERFEKLTSRAATLDGDGRAFAAVREERLAVVEGATAPPR